MQQFDSPWKQICDLFFPQLIAFYYPQAFEDIDWTQPHQSLDKELPKPDRECLTGNREADKLFSVHLKSGEERLIYIHIEFQHQFDPDLPLRMFVYNYRIFDRHQKPVISLAVLGDPSEQWHPDCFEYEQWDFHLKMVYPVIKLINCALDAEALQASTNPFAIVTAAHLAALQTRDNPNERLRQKFTLTRMLYDKGFTKAEIIALFKFIDWVLDLPTNLESQFKTALSQFEGERNMEYITSIERLGRAEGRAQGRAEGRAQGRAEGRAEERETSRLQALHLLHRFLKQRRNPIPQAWIANSECADSKTLHHWLEMLADGAEINEAFWQHADK